VKFPGFVISRSSRFIIFLTCVAVAGVDIHAQEAEVASTPLAAPVPLAATVHPPIPDRPADFWLVPENLPRTTTTRAESATQKFARGAALIDEGSFSAGLPLVSAPDLAVTPLARYAQYYRAVALAGLNRLQDAEDALDALAARNPEGYLAEAVPIHLAEVHVSKQDARHAVSILDDLRKDKGLTSPEDVWIRLGRAAEAAGDRDKAIEAYRKVYYESPLSMQAIDAQYALERLDMTPFADKWKLELGRAERLFIARRYAQARAGFVPVASMATGDESELIALRLAECDYYLDRFRAARDGVAPFLTKSQRQAEARFFYLTATRALGDNEAYVAQARALVSEFPDSTWAAETLNNLASHYVIADDDAAADGVFRELFQRFPNSRYAERAASRIGWWAYKNGQFAEAAQAFESGAAAFPRADNRPLWLYWAGRAHDQTGEAAIANERYRLEVADYQNSYYGRLASKILEEREEPPVDVNVTVAAASGTPPIPTEAVIRELVGLAMYDAALSELQYAQRKWGDAPAIAATVAWIRHVQAQNENAPERFDHLRGAINVMKRAYPQYLASGGEGLPPAILEVIYPLDYWPLIRKYADANGLDPYLMAALVAQESTFTADVRSGANAYGLMQLLPATGRVYARKAGLGRFSIGMLTQAEPNIRMGMKYFKDLADRLGGAHYALASYNAGPSKVSQWIAERPGIPQDEFIDDIPFPETQNYVKRILGTAEDYRRLYGEGVLTPGGLKEAAEKPAPKTPAAKKAPAKKKTR
jgi:soluble lytic murein transglycosylase